MLTLLHALQDETADHWRVVAQAWGVEYPASARDPLPELIALILAPERVAEYYRSLPEPAREGVVALRRAGGKMPVAEFFHRFGEIRSMGPARRRREQPWRNPASVSEHLWYAGWLGRAFIRSGSTAQEYVFLPGDLEALIPAGSVQEPPGWNFLSYQPGRRAAIRRNGTRSAEDACTLLAFIRNWPQSAQRGIRRWRPHAPLERHAKGMDSFPLLVCLLTEQGGLSGDPLRPDPKKARTFLERTPEGASTVLLRAWRDSSAWNELEQMGGLAADGAWPNDPVRARRAFLEVIRAAPRGQWCTIDSAVTVIRQAGMEFLRPASEFDSWNLRDSSGDYLRGIDSWERVEGALVRFYLTGPMAWLGAADLAPREAPKAFRLAPLSDVLWDGEPPSGAETAARARLRTDGSLLLLPDTPLLLRYQLARCADWPAQKGGAYVYRITPQSLARAREQGVRAAHILSLLENLLGSLPAALSSAVRRWESRGTEALIRSERLVVPRSPEAAAKLAELAEKDRGMIARLDGPAYIVPRTAAARLRRRLIEQGFLLEEEDEL
jgi:hypothetical protein